MVFVFHFYGVLFHPWLSKSEDFVRCTRSWRLNWTHVSWPPTCISETRWHSESCSQFSLWEIVQSKPLRRCWTSSWNSLTLSTCVSSTSWNAPSNSTSIRDSFGRDTKVDITVFKCRKCIDKQLSFCDCDDWKYSCPYSMWSRVYETFECPSVRPSVCPIDRQQQRLAAGLLLKVPPEGDIDR